MPGRRSSACFTCISCSMQQQVEGSSCRPACRCFLPGLSKANTGDCFFYETDESNWVQQVSTCGGGDFTTGFIG